MKKIITSTNQTTGYSPHKNTLLMHIHYAKKKRSIFIGTDVNVLM